MSSVTCLRLIGRQLIGRHMNGCLSRGTKYRSLSLNLSGSGSYEGDGKTTVSVINKDNTSHLLVDAYSTRGFRLSNGLFAYGPIALFPSTVLQWDVESADQIDEKSLSLYTVLEPRIEVLIIGFGDEEDISTERNELNRKLRLILNKLKINCEVMPTKHAISTYNYLCVDHRVCAGAFIPPLTVNYDKVEDLWQQTHSNRFMTSEGTTVFS